MKNKSDLKIDFGLRCPIPATLLLLLSLTQPLCSRLAMAQTVQDIVYDANGNMTQDENGNLYGYDGENRLISFVKGDGTVKTAYTYYADGLRKSKQITLKEKPASDPILFYYDHAQNANVINEVQGSGNKAVTSSYLMVGDTRYARYLSNDPGGAKYYVKNHKDTTMTVGSGGQNPTSHAYTPYGAERAASVGTASAGAQTSDFSIASNPFLYSSQYTDAESGLQYLRARYYKADHMRFISRDTNSVPRNKYAYANGNPIMEDDPSGMMANWVNYLLNGAGLVASLAGVVAGGGTGIAGVIAFGSEMLGAVSGVTGIMSQVAADVGGGKESKSLNTISEISGIASLAGGIAGAGIGAANKALESWNFHEKNLPNMMKNKSRKTVTFSWKNRNKKFSFDSNKPTNPSLGSRQNEDDIPFADRNLSRNEELERSRGIHLQHFSTSKKSPLYTSTFHDIQNVHNERSQFTDADMTDLENWLRNKNPESKEDREKKIAAFNAYYN